MTTSIGISCFICSIGVDFLLVGGIGFDFASPRCVFPFLLMAALVVSLRVLEVSTR